MLRIYGLTTTAPAPVPPVRDTHGRPRFSVMLPTHEPDERLCDALASVLAQAMPADAMQIVVVDDASRPGLTRSLVRSIDPHGRVEVVDHDDRLGLAGTTYVIYMSDNGAGGGGGGWSGGGRGGGKGGGRNAGLSGGKGSVWEGGIRVPFIVRGPGVAANSWCHVPVVGYDLFPTFCEWAGVPRTALPKTLEGGSVATLLSSGGKGEVTRPREELVFHFPHYQTGNTPHSAIRLGNLKLIKMYEDDSVRLFDLDSDMSERDDLAARRPADAARLRSRLEQYLATVQAQLPTKNSQYDPSAAPQQERGGGGKGGSMKGDKKNRRRPA